MSVWLTIPCHRPRLEWLRNCISSTGIPRERVVVVTNGPQPIEYPEIEDLAAFLECDTTPGLNISRWWNIGMDVIHREAEAAGETDYEIIVANADTLASPEIVDRMSRGLRAYGVAAVAGDQGKMLIPGTIRLSHDPKDYAFMMHMWGYWFMLAGEKKLRANEDIRWWLSDNALEIEAKLAGGFALLGGVRVRHLAQTPYEEPYITMGAEDRLKLDAHYYDLDYFGIRARASSQ